MNAKAKKILKASYKEWLTYYPNDTLKALDVFLNELEEFVSITFEQRELLFKCIIDRLNKWDLNNVMCDGIVFMGEDISYEIRSVLTIDQYCKYFRKRIYSNFKKRVANKRLYFYYTIQKKIPNGMINETIKQEIFKK